MNLVQIYFKKLKKLAVFTNILAFFLFLLENFPSWIQIRIRLFPGGKMNADPDQQP